jgi:molybdopterin adenylyltransferase
MPSQSTQEHREQAGDRAVACAVLTVSDTRTPQTDEGGPLIQWLLEEGGHAIVDHAICRDDPTAIGEHLDRWIARPQVQAIVTTGGTGIAKRDSTIDIVRRMLTIELEGFGELFRMLSWREVGAAAMLSRATAGVVIDEQSGDTFIFTLPGSTNAIETAMRNLIVPELAHLVWERKK